MSCFGLVLSAAETGSYGNTFNGQSEPASIVNASFAGMTFTLTLSFSAFDVYDPGEIEIPLTDIGLGFVPKGRNTNMYQEWISDGRDYHAYW